MLKLNFHNLANKLEVLMPVEIRLEELRHRLNIESAVCEGAKNAVNIIQMQKNDKKPLQQVFFSIQNLMNSKFYLFVLKYKAQSKLNESLEKISLLNLSWQRLLKTISSRVNYEKANIFLNSGEMMPKPAPITGQLEVRLLGCQDLLENVPDRHQNKRDSFNISNALDKTPKSLKVSGVMSTSKSYTVRSSDTSSKTAFNYHHNAFYA